MRRAFPVLSIIVFSWFTTSLVGDEPRAKEQPVGDPVKQLADKDPEKVCAAARALGKLGPAAKDATPALKELLKSRNGRVKWTAAEALWVLEHKATELVPIYSELLTATDAEVRAASAWRLGRLGNDARPAVLLLAAALRDESFEVRVQVGQALANLGQYAEPALPALVRALGDSQLDEPSEGRPDRDSVRSSPALPALVEMADDSIPLLIATFHENAAKREREGFSRQRDWEVPSRVALVFPAFGGRAVAPLLQCLESKDADTRGYAVLALQEIAKLNGLPENAIEKLEKCLDDPDKSVRRRAASAMSWVRPSSTKAITILTKAKEEDFGLGSKALLDNLSRMCAHNEAARQLLLTMLEEKSAETVQEAYRILATLDLPPDQVVGVWTKALSHADPKVRFEAIIELWHLGPSAKPAKAALHERSKKEDDSWNKSRIPYVLTAIDPDDPALIPFLIESMDDRDFFVCRSAISSLAGLGPRAKDTIPKIEALLSNPRPREEGKAKTLDEYLVRELVTALVRIAPDSSKTATTLLKALRNQDIRALHGLKNTWFMRDVLEDNLQANLPTAAPLLVEALKDENLEVRKSAALVLVRAGLEIDTALPVLMDKLWTDKDNNRESSRFRSRVVELLMRRQQPATPAIAAAWCKAWRTASPEGRNDLK